MATSCGLDLARNLESMGIRVGMQGLSSDADNEAVNASGVYPSINLVTVPSRRFSDYEYMEVGTPGRNGLNSPKHHPLTVWFAFSPARSWFVGESWIWTTNMVGSEAAG